MQDIILFNAGLRQDLEKGTGVEQLMEHWDMLQVNCAAYINSDLPGLPANHQAAPTKPTRSVFHMVTVWYCQCLIQSVCDMANE